MHSKHIVGAGRPALQHKAQPEPLPAARRKGLRRLRHFICQAGGLVSAASFDEDVGQRAQDGRWTAGEGVYEIEVRGRRRRRRKRGQAAAEDVIVLGHGTLGAGRIIFRSEGRSEDHPCVVIMGQPRLWTERNTERV